MIGSATSKAPSAATVVPYYMFGALSFFALSVLLLFSSDALDGHYFHPKLLAIVHVAALGWATMIIFGALFQLLPVILETSLFSERLAKITFFIFAAGIIFIAYSFWNFYVGRYLQIASILVFIAFLLFIINMAKTIYKISVWNIETDFIITSCLWLLITGTLGVMMAFNFNHPFLTKPHLLFLKIHAHAGIVGWIFMLIMGVGSKLIPMFLLSKNLNTKKLTYAYYFVNIGLIGFGVDLFMRDEKALLLLYVSIIVIGILFFISFLFEAYKKRMRKQLDIGLKHSFVSILFLFLPIIIGIILSFSNSGNNAFTMRIYLVYGVAIFLGFITSLILGQTFKTLPFIIWLYSYKKNNGKQKTILPKDLYSEKIISLQYIFYLITIPTLILGILLSQPILIKAGSLLLLITAFLYNMNVFKILFYAVQTKKI